jgi:hypothetical protein
MANGPTRSWTTTAFGENREPLDYRLFFWAGRRRIELPHTDFQVPYHGVLIMGCSKRRHPDQ